MEAADFSEMFVGFYHTCHHILEDRNLHNHEWKNLIPHKSKSAVTDFTELITVNESS
jgi:hypothetical protein